MLRFLHTADLHLGARITRFEENACKRIGEARFWAIENLRAKAAEYRVDFVLIAGDLFDDHSVTHTLAERAFALFEGKAMPCPVYIIAGNHDPLVPGGVWDRDPWSRAQPTKNIRFLRDAAPVDVPGLPVTLFPCPLRARNSVDDPTAWIAKYPRAADDAMIRIGLAHGSLRIMPNLPEDDHLIRADAADRLGLDYLALGHWHKPLRHRSSAGPERTAYSGTHEPMRFPDSGAGLSTGWSSFSSDAGDGNAERFQDGGRGTAQIVSIHHAGAVPQIETIEVGKLQWVAAHRDLTSHSLGEIISEFGDEKSDQDTLLRLTLSGVLAPEQHARIDGVLREVVCLRYCLGSSLHAENVLIKPDPDQLSRVVGAGVLSRVLSRLEEESQSADLAVKRVADHALKLLYEIAWKGQQL